MDRDIEEILRGLTVHPFPGYQGVVDLANNQPARIGQLVLRSVTALPKSSTAINAALGLVPDSDLPGIADASVAAIRNGADKNRSQAADLITRLSLQAPHTLRPHLSQLWSLRPNERSYDATWPWRGGNTHEVIAWLLARIADAEPAEDERGFRCLLESRTPEGTSAALALVGKGIVANDRADVTLLDFGLERRDVGVARLFVDDTYHIIFPTGFLRLPTWIDVTGTMVDPTWRPTTRSAGKGRFGGSVAASCRVCDQPLHRLLTIDTPELVRTLGAGERLELITCLSCLGWSEPVLFFEHSNDVRPVEQHLLRRTPEFPAAPLPEAELRFVETPPRWRFQDWGCSNGRENLNRLGGEPTWIQQPEFPRCPACRRTMMFLMQLDSLDIDAKIDWMWGSGGILYVFWCSSCLISGTLWQCT